MTTEQIAQLYGVPASVLAQPLQRSVNYNLPEEWERFNAEVNAELDQFVSEVLSNEFTLSAQEVRQYFGWGHQANEQCKESFVVITASTGNPYPGHKGFRKLWRIGGIVTDRPIITSSDSEPVVGDVACTVQGERIEIVSAEYI